MPKYHRKDCNTDWKLSKWTLANAKAPNENNLIIPVIPGKSSTVPENYAHVCICVSHTNGTACTMYSAEEYIHHRQWSSCCIQSCILTDTPIISSLRRYIAAVIGSSWYVRRPVHIQDKVQDIKTTYEGRMKGTDCSYLRCRWLLPSEMIHALGRNSRTHWHCEVSHGHFKSIWWNGSSVPMPKWTEDKRLNYSKLFRTAEKWVPYKLSSENLHYQARFQVP